MASPTERWINTWRNGALYKIVADEFAIKDPDENWDQYDRAYRVLGSLRDAGLTVIPEADAKALADFQAALKAIAKN